MNISDDAVELANKRAAQKKTHYPAAVNVQYDRRSARLVIELASGLGITISPKHPQGLEDASPADLESAQISPSGLGIHFPNLDANVYLPALLEGLLGTKRWMAARNGEAGGKARTEAKAAAARKNGTLGGRPKKSAAEIDNDNDPVSVEK
jgi:hypothetical protein